MDAPFSTDELLQQTRWLHRLARGLVGDRALADDLVQDTMAAALARPPRMLRDLRAWLATVLRRHAQKQARRRAARPEVERRAARSEATPAADAVVAQAMVHRDVVDAVLALAEPYRTAILLRYLHDLPIGDVAARTGVPLLTARSHVQRGLVQLRARLDHRYGSRAAWCAPLGAAPAFGAAAAVLLLMNTKTLASLVAAGVVAATALWWLAPDQRLPSPPLAGSARPDRVDAAVAELAEPPPAVRALARLDDVPTRTIATALAVAVGTAIDEETRRPLEGVEVTWYDDGGASAPPAATTRTDAAGHFELASDVLDPNHGATVLLRRTGFAWVTRKPGDPEGTAPQRFLLGTIPLPPGTGVAGTVVDSAGATVAGATILYYDTLFYADRGRTVDFGGPLVLGRTGADGAFAPSARIAPAQDGLLAAVCARGFGWLQLAGVTRARNELGGLRIVLALGCDVAVHVQDRTGAPAAGVTVFANPEFEPLGVGDGWQRPLDRVPGLADLFVAVTDAHGEARLPALPRDTGGRRYRLRTARAGFLVSERAIDVAWAAAQVRLTIAPPRAIEVTGTVTDGNGRPLAGATVAVTRREPQATTRDDGTFVATVAVQDAMLTATARANGHQPQEVQVHLEPEQDRLELTFRLRPAADLAGVVVDEAEQPVADATVIAVGQRATAVTDRQGRFVLANVPIGTSLDLDVDPPGEAAGWDRLPYFAVSTVDSPVTLRLRRRTGAQCTLVAELLAADGAPLESKRHQLYAGGTQWHPSTATIGRVDAEQLAPGPWTLRVEALRGASLAVEFTIAAGEREHHLTLRQSPSATVAVEIVPEPVDLSLPVELRVCCSGDNCGAFVPSDGQRLDGGTLVLTTARGLAFRLEDIDPARPLQLAVEGDGWRGEATVAAPAAAPTPVRIALGRTGTLRFVADAPWPQHGLTLYVHRPGEPRGEANRFEDLEGRTELLRWSVGAGPRVWRIETLPGGAPQPTVWEGRVEVPAGGEVTVRVGEPTRR